MAISALLYGSVHPLGNRLGFDDSVTVTQPGWGRFHVSMAGGRFQVDAEFEHDDHQDLVRITQEIVQGLVDALGFHLGLGAIAEIEGGRIAPNTVLILERHYWPEVVGTRRGDPLRVEGGELQPYVSVGARVPVIRYALADIRLAIREATDTAFYAYRACDSVRQWFQRVEPPTTKERVGWKRLRAALDIDEDELKRLARMSTDRRHGDCTYISAADRLWAVRLARTIVERAVEIIAEESETRTALPTPEAAATGDGRGDHTGNDS